jgi:gamma-glutamylaminecyclotransferase
MGTDDVASDGPGEATFLFVYGTLKRGEPNHDHLVGARFLGKARTQPIYRLLDLGAYPGLVRNDPDGRSVLGELWEVGPDTLARLDEFEEVPQLFLRQAVQLTGHSGPAQAYFYRGRPARK